MSSLRSRATPATVGPHTQAEHHTNFWEAETPLRESRRTAREELQRKAEALALVLEVEPVASHVEPAHLTSTANRRGISRQAMQAHASGAKSQRALGERIAAAFLKDMRDSSMGHRFGDPPGLYVAVHLCRIAPHELDSDNLESAFKAIRDGIATGLGVNDRSPRVRYVVSQEQGGVREHLVRASLHISRSEVHQDKETP